MERCRKELLLRYTFELDSAQQQGMCITNKYFRKWAVMAGKCWLECEHWGRRATVATAAGARGCMFKLCMGRVVSGVVTSARCHSGVGGRQPPAYQKGVVRYPFGKRAVVGISGSGWTTARTARTVGGGQRAAKTVTAAMGGGQPAGARTRWAGTGKQWGMGRVGGHATLRAWERLLTKQSQTKILCWPWPLTTAKRAAAMGAGTAATSAWGTMWRGSKHDGVERGRRPSTCDGNERGAGLSGMMGGAGISASSFVSRHGSLTSIRSREITVPPWSGAPRPEGDSDPPSWQQMGVNVAGVDGGSEHERREGAGGAEALIPAAYLSAVHL
ncbi:hypothetical protein GGX14DRAFT_402529 [Mycena pura]|uniref:Uncharacterized protein n=1 Tax=Mycena pura TaxID=153505 RepID=A0AAD6UYQ5_9AGAR|nr:hypothetical protein GGX14DRAFT_402529 [Mycena pura]